MRRFWGLLVLSLVAASTVTAGTITFDRGLVSQAGFGNGTTPAGFINVQISSSLSLLAQPVSIELMPGETIGMIHVSATETVSDESSMAGSLRDLPTTLDAAYAGLIVPAREQNTLGRTPVYAVGEETCDGKRYAHLLIFPVTVNEKDQESFHDSIQISVGDRETGGTTLLSSPESEAGTTPSRTDGDAVRSTQFATGEYLIVTNQALADAARELLAYKIQTGYHASLAFIEEVVGRYAGRDDAERLRNCLKDFYAQGGQYVLLCGDETVLPIRYAYDLDASGSIDVSVQQVCDLYFADLTGDWNRDNDSIWGERTGDAADLTPELMVGRLPVNTPEEVRNYTGKLIRYESNPGNGDAAYVQRALFFCSDQMRDYTPTAQHSYVAKSYPSRFSIDSTTGVEATRGDDPTPSNLAPTDMGPVMSEGFGIINVIAHGRDDGFAVKTSGYNTGLKAMLWTNAPSGESNSFASLQAVTKPAFYYSLACDNGAFDKSSPPFNYGTRNMAQELIGELGGAVGLVANTRWGWIGTSYILQRCFFDSLFAHPERPAIAAMYATKARFYYFRDLVLGQVFFGDPSLHVYTAIPAPLKVASLVADDAIRITVTSAGQAGGSCQVVVSDSSGIVGEFVTDANGELTISSIEFTADHQICIAAVKEGATIDRTWLVPPIATDVNDHDAVRPAKFSLDQNYPNPFNPTTTIRFDLPHCGHTSLVVYDVLGREVKTLLDDVMPVGNHEVFWDGSSVNGSPVASGVYFYRLSADTYSDTKKMLLLK